MARTSSSFLALPVTKVTAFGSTRAAADIVLWWDVARQTLVPQDTAREAADTSAAGGGDDGGEG
jgi:hypothetical protein